LTLARKAQKEVLIGQSSRSHATSPTVSGLFLVCFLARWILSQYLLF